MDKVALEARPLGFFFNGGLEGGGLGHDTVFKSLEVD
jgi:hypothetical protein